MEVHFHRLFKKQFHKLHPKIQQKADKVIAQFVKNPRALALRNHPLRGSMLGERSISVTGDIRIVFKEYDNYKKVTLLRIGTHNQVY